MRNLYSILRFALALGGGWKGAISAGSQVYKNDGLQGIFNALQFLARRAVTSSTIANGGYPKVSDHETWLAALVESAGKIDARLQLVPLYERANDPISRPFGTRVTTAFGEILSKWASYDIGTFIFVPVNGVGGADKVARELAKEIAKQRPNKRVIILETLSTSADILTENSEGYLQGNILQARFGLTEEEQLNLIRLLVGTIQPERVINVNSELCWKSFSEDAEYLKTVSSISGAFFCPDFDARGFDRGYSVQYFGSVADRLDHIVTDNGIYVDELQSAFNVNLEGKTNVVTLYQPVEVHSTREVLSEPPTFKNNRVLWAARICRQKGIDILPDIAELCPELEFHVYGAGWIGDERKLKTNSPENVIFHGKYQGMEEALDCKPAVFLHNALWDGIPNSLLEIGSAGIPIVSSPVGAISDLLGFESGRAHLINDPNSAEKFADGLKRVISDVAYAKSLASELSRHLKSRHSREQYERTVRTFIEATENSNSLE